MESKKINLLELKNIVKQLIKEEKENKKTYYIKWSSFFDTNPYDIKLIEKAVKDGGGKKVKKEHAYGWANQPKVVVFDADDDILESVLNNVKSAVGTQWIIADEKDWK
jgi:hypothetical protein